MSEAMASSDRRDESALQDERPTKRARVEDGAENTGAPHKPRD